MRHNIGARYGNVQLRPLHTDDLEALRNWRNDQEFTKYLTPIDEISIEAQLNWFEKDIANPDSYTFAIDEAIEFKRFVGSVGLYEFTKVSAECGRFLIDSTTSGKGIGFLAITLCLYIGFERLGLERITAVVHENNVSALRTDQKGGFVIVGERPYKYGGKEIEIVAERSYFFKLHDFLNEIVLE